jgi:hypothetical protein
MEEILSSLRDSRTFIRSFPPINGWAILNKRMGLYLGSELQLLESLKFKTGRASPEKFCPLVKTHASVLGAASLG